MKKLPLRIDGYTLLTAIGKKVEKLWSRVTAEDIHQTGHVKPYVFHKQVDIISAQYIVDHPEHIFESD